MAISAHRLCILAAQLAREHGALARDYARRASFSLEADGDKERARFWMSLSVLVEDVVLHRIDPDHTPTIH
ncbi:MAG TPA: hypothetical protein VMU01_05575 [Rhizomicrobium sp.]|nr:hypothetical protein [Rhizomicrobium sp.]